MIDDLPGKLRDFGFLRGQRGQLALDIGKLQPAFLQGRAERDRAAAAIVEFQLAKDRCSAGQTRRDFTNRLVAELRLHVQLGHRQPLQKEHADVCPQTPGSTLRLRNLLAI